MTGLTITAPPIAVMGSDNVAKTMAYTAFINNGQVEKNPDFEITQNNVVSVVASGKLTLLSTNGLGFSKAQITDANQKTTDVPIVNDQVTFTTPEFLHSQLYQVNMLILAL